MRWLTSFLSKRQQRVKIGNVVSSWSTLIGGMPQGTFLGVYFFLIHINDLQSSVPLIKFIDDITAIETISKSGPSNLQSTAGHIVRWSEINRMKVNIKKTKDMIIDFSRSKQSPPQIEINSHRIE